MQYLNNHFYFLFSAQTTKKTIIRKARWQQNEDLTKVFVRNVNLFSLFTAWNGIRHCRNPPFLSLISQDHSLLAPEARSWKGRRWQPAQKFGGTKKSNSLWLSADLPNIAKFKEICWHVFVRKYSGGCWHECNNFKQLSDIFCMSMAEGTTNMQEKGFPDYWRRPQTAVLHGTICMIRFV